jgi:hypothetical protein
MPNDTFSGKVTFKAFQIDPQTRTLDARIEVDNSDLKLRPGMFANAAVMVPVVSTIKTPATTQPVMAITAAQVVEAYAAALEPYFKAQKRLSEDSIDEVPALLQEVVVKLKPVAGSPVVSSEYSKLTDAAAAAKDKPIKEVRAVFKDTSSGMLAIGKSIGIPESGPKVQPFRCAMVSAPWLQPPGEKANPYMGSSMLTCGDNLPPLPQYSPKDSPGTAMPIAGRVMAVPRSAVIDTGKNKIVYVASAEGVYDMRAVKLGPPAGDFYPVLAGLDEGQSVVTVGAFLIDAENRLNPSGATDAAADSHDHSQGAPGSAPATAPMSGVKM